MVLKALNQPTMNARAPQCTNLLMNGVCLYVFANQKHVTISPATKGGGIIQTDASFSNWEAAGCQEEDSSNNQKSLHAACMRAQVV